MSRTVIVTIGTTGDVLPFITLGAALGTPVTIVTHPSFRTAVEQAGLGFAPLPLDLPVGSPLTSAGLARLLAPRWLEIGRAVAAAAQDADLLVLAALGWLGYHVAEALGVPSMGAFLQPLEPTSAFPPPLLTTRSLGARGNRAAARWFRLAGQVPFARATAELRRELGLPSLGPAATFRRMDRERWPVLHGFSPAVVPAPADWPSHRPLTGYWWPRAAGGLSPRLREFLDEGEPPVFIGFGSMAARGLGAMVGEALTRLGRRAVVQRGAADLSPDLPASSSRDVLVVGPEPHAELFPRVAAVVHHAGAGTTAAALRAGVPAVCVPFTADQPFWAHRVAALGAGPPPVRRPTPGRLAAAIDAAGSYRAGAEAVARQLAAEDGVARAAAEIHEVRRLA